MVEAVPADGHLGRSDRTPTFDMEESLDDYLIGDDVFEPRGHASLLRGKEQQDIQKSRDADLQLI